MRQKRKQASKIERRLKWFIPTGAAEVLIRANTIEEALRTYDKYYGDRAAVDMTRVRKEKVKFIETIEKGEWQFARNNSIRGKHPKKKAVEVKEGLYESDIETDFLDIKIL